MSEQVNVILAPMAGRTVCTTKTVYQYNSGMLLKLIGIDLPTGYEVDFANSATGSSITQVGNADGVRIPDQFFVPGSTIHAWYVAVGTDYAVTRYHIMIPIAQRASRTNEEPTQTQESALDEAIAALNDAIEHSPKIEDGDWYVWDASTGAWVNTGVQAEGQDGFSPVVGIGKIGTRITLTITDAEGPHSVYLYDGTDGVGISSIAKTATAGLVDTYTVTLTNGQTAEFNVTNGANGTNGTDGVSPVVTVTDITGGHRVTITDADGTQTFDVMDGADGQTGPSGADGYSPTASVSKSGSTATITITDKNGTTTATVSDGSNGSNGQDGQPGADGYSPTASVTKSGTTATITITDKNGTTTATVSDGQAGPGVASGGTQGQMLVKKSGTDYDTEWANQPVTDVQVNGTSAVTNGVANVPAADANTFGVVKKGSGLSIDAGGKLGTNNASDTGIKDGTSLSSVLTPGRQHQSVFYGLAKAAGDSSQSASSNAVGEYTADAKKAIRKMLGIPNQEWELINEVTLSEDSTEILINTDSNGQTFKLIRAIALFSCGPSTTGTKDSFFGTCYYNFLSNSVLISGGDSIPSITYDSATSNMMAQIVMDTHYPAPITILKISAANNNSTRTVESMAKDRCVQSITGIKIYQGASNKSLVPSGAKLTLYGIRMDE